MIAGALAIAKGAWSMAGRAMKAVGGWMRKKRPPGYWSRMLAAVLAVVCMGFAFAVRDARQEVLIVTERCNSQLVTIESKARVATTTAEENRRALNTCQVQLKAEVGKAQNVERLADEAVAAARKDAAEARQSLKDWQATYNKRPATCRAALEALEAACPTITDY